MTLEEETRYRVKENRRKRKISLALRKRIVNRVKENRNLRKDGLTTGYKVTDRVKRKWKSKKLHLIESGKMVDRVKITKGKREHGRIKKHFMGREKEIGRA